MQIQERSPLRVMVSGDLPPSWVVRLRNIEGDMVGEAKKYGMFDMPINIREGLNNYGRDGFLND